MNPLLMMLALALPQADAPAPNKADEKAALAFAPERVATFLDQINLAWTRQRKCGTCHTNYPYVVARPLIGKPGAEHAEVLAFFQDRARNWDKNAPRWPAEVVATAQALALHDRLTGAKETSEPARMALERQWKLQRPDGAWDWLKCDWPPSESDDGYGAVAALLATTAAPGYLEKTANAVSRLDRITAYLKTVKDLSLHHRLHQVWAAHYDKRAMAQEERDATLDTLLKLQRPDGGWSLSSLGKWKRKDGTPNEPETAPSDGYATGLAVMVLVQSKGASDATRKGVAWLLKEQKDSGRWFVRSLNNDKAHFITHAGTAYAVLGLHAAGALPTTVKP